MGRYRIRKRHGRWEVLRPYNGRIGPVLMSGTTYEYVLARLCYLLKYQRDRNLQRARAT